MYELGVLKDAGDSQMKDFHEGYEDYGLKKMRNKNILKNINEGNLKKPRISPGICKMLKRLTYVRGKAVHLQNPNRQSFDVVAEVRIGSDDRDKFYIYHVNNSVFKSSLKIVKVAVLMDQTSSTYNALQEGDSYFDGTHIRVRGFKTLALWLFHPGMRCILRLATMDVRAESTQQISIFWNILNEMLREVTGRPDYIFNPPKKLWWMRMGTYYCSVRGNGNHLHAVQTCWLSVQFQKQHTALEESGEPKAQTTIC